MYQLSNRVTVDENICNGKPTIRGMRITVQTVLEFLFAGDTPLEILTHYPSCSECSVGQLGTHNEVLKFATSITRPGKLHFACCAKF